MHDASLACSIKSCMTLENIRYQLIYKLQVGYLESQVFEK